MANEIKTSKNYAQALIELAKDNASLKDTFFNEMKEINLAFNKVTNTKKTFESPAISKEEKKSIITKLFKGKINEMLFNFLNVLIENDRFFLLEEIQNQYLILLNKSKGIVKAEVFSAHELDSSATEALKKKLESLFGNVEIESKIESGLIGGLKLKINDLVYDGSIKSRLEGLKRRLG
jgi:F-type H+-transporting ATPase subunit delta